MHLYIAALYTSNFDMNSRFYREADDNIKAMRRSITHHLESYHYIKAERSVRKIREDGIKVFLDSGAFSAFSLGATIDIGAYADYIKTNIDIIDHASVLDAIGDPVGTFHNQKELERLGCEVLPCYHYGEPEDLCEYYVRNYEYITLGGMVPIPNSKLEPWLDHIWDTVLTDKDGYARTKVHGFGQTSSRLMVKYPWYSVDSSSWVQIARTGNIALPETNLRPFGISDNSPSRKRAGAHMDNKNVFDQELITKYLDYYGVTRDQLGRDYVSRWALCALAYHLTGAKLGEDHWRKPFRAQQGSLF